jgi:UDP-N-acetylglucosamine acyltransferase
VARVHPTAVVDPAAKLADDAEVGPYAVIGDGVELSAGVVVGAHALLEGQTRLGARTRIGAFCFIGGPPQIRGGGRGTSLSIGSDNVIREYVSVHAGSQQGGTRIGDGNLLLHGSHVGHDCRVGSSCQLGSHTLLAGHVEVQDHAVLDAEVAVQQFGRVGESAYVAATTKLRVDVPPFARAAGSRPRFIGLNRVGLRRRGFPESLISELGRAFHLLLRSRLQLAPALARVRRDCGGPVEVEHLCRFVENAQRGVTR